MNSKLLVQTSPWRKFRIEIHFEPIQIFPNHSGICIRTKQFHFDLIRRKFSILFNQSKEAFQSVRPAIHSQEKQSVNLILISGYHLPATKISLGSVNTTLKQGIISPRLGVWNVICCQLFGRFAAKTIDDSFGPQVWAILYLILKLAATNFIPEVFLCSDRNLWSDLRLDRNETVWFGYKFRNKMDSKG